MADLPVVVYRQQPWTAVDRLVLAACPPDYQLLVLPRDAPAQARHSLLARADFLMGSWVTTAVSLDAQDYAAARRLKLVQLMSAGYEHVDLDLAARFGVPVATFGDAMASVVAEHTLLLILAAYRRLLQLDSAVRSGAWRTAEPVLHELRGKRVGLIGLGYIGRQVAVRLRAFGAEVVYFSRSRVADDGALGATYLSLDELLASSDVVSLHVPLSGSTRRLIGPRQIASMKPGAMLVNTSRGPIVDQAALVDALRSGSLAVAGLDVLDPEPPEPTAALLGLPNVVFTPHVGGQAEEVWPRIVQACFSNIQRVARGEQPRFIARKLD